MLEEVARGGRLQQAQGLQFTDTVSATPSNMTYNPSRSSSVGVLAIAMSVDVEGDDSSMRRCLLLGESAFSTNEGWSLAGRFLFRDVIDGLPGASAIKVKGDAESMAATEIFLF